MSVPSQVLAQTLLTRRRPCEPDVPPRSGVAMNSATEMPADFPRPLAAYSHAMATTIGDATMLFIAGQMALDATGAVVSPAVEVQTEFIFASLGTILAAAGMTFADLVKVQIFLTD